MRKDEFLRELRDGLAGLPQNEIEKRVAFYAEMIDDRMEEGLSEEEAVAAVGTVYEIVLQAAEEFPEQVSVRIKPKRKLSAMAIVLLILGSPVWVSLLIAAFAVVLALWASLWAVIVSLWSVFVAVTACAPAGIAIGIHTALLGDTLTGIAILGFGTVCAGLAIFFFFGCRASSQGAAWLTKKTACGIVRLFRKEGAQ